MATVEEKDMAGAEKENSVGGLVALRKKLHDRLVKLVASGSQDFGSNVGSYGHKRIAEERGQRALSVLRERQLEDDEERTSHIRARRQALEVERDRARFIASLPVPAKEFQPSPKIEKEVEVYNYDFNSMGICRIPLHPGTVQKANPDREVDAHAAAVAYREQNDGSGKARAAEEAKVKAKSRHREAVKKEKITRDYSSVMKELDRHQRATTFLPKKKWPKIKKTELSRGKTGGRQESSLEKAVERVMRETDDSMGAVSLANVTMRKKKAAKLSIGKQHSTKTAKGTLTTKQSALGSYLSRLRNEHRQSTSLRTSSASSSNLSKVFSETGASVVLDGAARSTRHKHIILPCSPLTVEDRKVEHYVVEPITPPKIRTTKSSATQTQLTFHPNSRCGVGDPSSPSDSSYRSLPSGFGWSPTVAEILQGNHAQGTQTLGDLVTMYQKCLLSRAKSGSSLSTNTAAASASQKNSGTQPEGRSTPSPVSGSSRDLSWYIRQLAKERFSSPGDSAADVTTPSRTTSESVVGSEDSSSPVPGNANRDALDRRLSTEQSTSRMGTFNRRQLPSRRHASVFSPPMLRPPAKVPGKPTKQQTNSDQRIMARKISQKTSYFTNPVFRKEFVSKTCPRTVVQESGPIGSEESASSAQRHPDWQERSISLSPPVTLTLTSPESTLVVHLSGPEEESTASPKSTPTSKHSIEKICFGDESSSRLEKSTWVPQPFIPIRVNPLQHRQENHASATRPFFTLSPTVLNAAATTDGSKTETPSSASRFLAEESWLPASLTSSDKSLSQRLSRATDRSEDSVAIKPLSDGTPKRPYCTEGSLSRSNLPSQSPEEMQSIMTMLLTRNDDWHVFRPRPPASLPFEFRQFVEPHELSTIAEVDTPHTSGLKDASGLPCENNNIVLASTERQREVDSSGSSSFVTLTPVSRLGGESNNTDARVPLWEHILGSGNRCSPRLLANRSPKQTPSHSTPIRDDVGYLPEFEEGVLEHSFISLVGSEITIDDGRVPDMEQSLRATSTSAGETWYTLTPHVPDKHSPFAAAPRGVAASPSLRHISVTDSVASFLRHELSCANETDRSGYH